MSKQPDHESLSLDEVTRLFSESETALGELRERFESLLAAEEQAAMATKSLAEASSQVSDFSKKSGELVDALLGVQSKLEAVLHAASEVLEGSDLKEMRKDFETATSRLEERFGDVESARAERDAAKSELGRISLALPKRLRRKLGLEE